ncbi:MAG: hypothetical protein JW940_16665 [Polyangiaceae bacterium]|nr:hypothetical protein [Polyangiaceae bacterium]
MTEDDQKLDTEQLKKRHADLNTRRIEAQTNLKNAEEHLERLKQDAREKWDTDDSDELRRKLEEMKKDNENKRASYQTHIEELDARLREVDKEYADSQPGGNPGSQPEPVW